jgi:hypothetical protein
MHGRVRKLHKILVRKLERITRRSRHRWEDNLRMDLREISWVWTGFTWLRIGTIGGLL